MNEMAQLRRTKSAPDYQFTQVPNEWLRHPTMGLAARAVLSWLISQKDGWVTSREALVAQNEWLTDHQARKALTELEELGILVRSQEYTPGSYGGGVWLIVYPGDSLSDEYHPTENEAGGWPLSGGELSDDGQPLKNTKEEDLKEDLLKSQLPPTGVAHAPEKQSTRGSRIPDPFIVTRSMREWAAEKVPGVDVNSTTEMFVDYWRSTPGSRGLKVDWIATWQVWLRKDFIDIQRRSGRGRVSRPVINEKTEAWAAFIGAADSTQREITQ